MRALIVGVMAGLGLGACTSPASEKAEAPVKAEASPTVETTESSFDPSPKTEDPVKAEASPTVETTEASSDPSPETQPPTTRAAEAPMPEAASPTFSLVARLLGVSKTSHCGVLHLEATMKFEVLRVLDGSFTPTTLYAVVSCPEMPPTRARGFSWTVGETYELKLRTAGRRRGGVLVDLFESEPGKRYELLHIEPSPGA